MIIEMHISQELYSDFNKLLELCCSNMTTPVMSIFIHLHLNESGSVLQYNYPGNYCK